MASQYPRNIITAKGYNLLAESIATKKAVVFTKVVVGNGDDSGKNISQMTNVISPKMTLPVSSAVKDGDGQYMITANLSNSTVEEGFFPREVALFAKIDGGEEIMYSYTNGGNQVGYIPDKNTPIDSEIYKIRTKIGNASNITFVANDDTYVTKGELTKHNTDSDAHGGLLQKVKTELSTHNTDASSHPAITNAIAKILGATDWQENPVATLKDIKNRVDAEGIVAKKFGRIGYIKYANGLLVQWGKFKDVADTALRGTSNRNITVTLPLSFKDANYSVVVSQINSQEFHTDNLDWSESILEKKVTPTNFIAQIDDYATGLFFICIGESI